MMSVRQLGLPMRCIYRVCTKPTQIYQLETKAKYSRDVISVGGRKETSVQSAMCLLQNKNKPDLNVQPPGIWQLTNRKSLNVPVIWQLTNRNSFDVSGIGQLTNRKSLDVSDLNIEHKLSNLFLSPRLKQPNQEYILPSTDRVSSINYAILDPQTLNSILDCPTKNNSVDVFDPLRHPMNEEQCQLPGTTNEIKEASSGKGTGRVVRQRRRKMNRHQRRKFLKRTRFLRWKIKQTRKRRKQAKWDKHLDNLKFKKLYAREIRQEIKKRQEEWSMYQKFVDFMNRSNMESSSKSQ